MAKLYSGTEDVIKMLKVMSDEQLEKVYAAGQRDKINGPPDGDVDLSDHLRSLVQAEVDRRIERGPEI